MGLKSSVLVLPDWLGRGVPPYGTVEFDAGEDADLAAERARLASNVHCFLENTLLQGNGECRPESYRVAAYWWLVILNTAILQKTGCGLEQFSSPEIYIQ